MVKQLPPAVHTFFSRRSTSLFFRFNCFPSPKTPSKGKIRRAVVTSFPHTLLRRLSYLAGYILVVGGSGGGRKREEDKREEDRVGKLSEFELLSRQRGILFFFLSFSLEQGLEHLVHGLEW